MLFRKRHMAIIEPPVAAFIREEQSSAQLNNDISYLGAVDNIKIIKKEDTLMIEKLKAYHAELEAKKATLVNNPIDLSDIEAKVTEYREKLTAEANADRDAKVAKIDSDLACIATLIEREEETIRAALATETIAE